MRITELLDKDFIVPALSAKTKKEVLKELVDCITRKETEVESDDLLRVLLEREELGSTGIGDGIAIPHGKARKIKRLIVAFGRSLDGVEFQSMDGKLTHIIFLLIAPEDSAGVHLKALARISRLLKDSAFRKHIMEANSLQEVYDLIAQEDEKF
jgi:PTS system nitrogen regulatory IIA component